MSEIEPITPEIVELNPHTVEEFRPRRPYFTIHSSQTVTISKPLATALGKIRGISFGYNEGDVFVWSDPRGFHVSMKGLSYQIASIALVSVMLSKLKLSLKTRYYVEPTADGKFRVISSQATNYHWKSTKGASGERQSVDVRGEQAKPSSQPA